VGVPPEAHPRAGTGSNFPRARMLPRDSGSFDAVRKMLYSLSARRRIAMHGTLSPRYHRPQPRQTMTAQGHPRTVFHRAIQRKNLVIAEVTAREVGAIDLVEALDLVCLVAEKAPERLDAYARRWLVRVADERQLRLAELDIALTALRALPSPKAVGALKALL
jgi:hypothetical protein